MNKSVGTVGDILAALPDETPATTGRAVTQPRSAPAKVSLNPMAMISQAVANGASIDVVERLMTMKREIDAEEARKAYVGAMAAFKALDTKIEKNKQVGFESRRTNTSTSYAHATLDTVCDAVNKGLADNGLSYDWDTVQDGQAIKVTCIVTHVGGHTKRVQLQAAADNSGNKNPIQAVGSTVTYLQRYTLLSALGLATSDMDDDGKGAQERGQTGSALDPITTEQIAKLQDGLDETGSDIAAFCRHMKVGSLAEILLRDYHKALTAIEDKRRKNGGAK